jgi:hypothetical protein
MRINAKKLPISEGKRKNLQKGRICNKNRAKVKRR